MTTTSVPRKYSISEPVVLGVDEGFDVPEDAQGKLAIVRQWVGKTEYLVYVPAINDLDVCVADYHIARKATISDLANLDLWR